MAKRLVVVPMAMLTVLLAAAPALLAQGTPTPAGSEVEAIGYLSPVYPREAYSHVLNDERTGATYFARSEDVDLDSYDDGQRVEVSGTLIMDERYAGAILQVTGMEPAEDPSPGETATLAFELSVEGEPPTDATFFSAVRGEVRSTYPSRTRMASASTLGARPYPGFPRE